MRHDREIQSDRIRLIRITYVKGRDLSSLPGGRHRVLLFSCRHLKYDGGKLVNNDFFNSCVNATHGSHPILVSETKIFLLTLYCSKFIDSRPGCHYGLIHSCRTLLYITDRWAECL
jgi:hypothetical protein